MIASKTSENKNVKAAYAKVQEGINGRKEGVLGPAIKELVAALDAADPDWAEDSAPVPKAKLAQCLMRFMMISSRKIVMFKTSLTALIIALVGMASAVEAKPNVLLIAIDDLNDWIDVWGDTRRRGTWIDSPHVEFFSPMLIVSHRSVIRRVRV